MVHTGFMFITINIMNLLSLSQPMPSNSRECVWEHACACARVGVHLDTLNSVLGICVQVRYGGLGYGSDLISWNHIKKKCLKIGRQKKNKQILRQLKVILQYLKDKYRIIYIWNSFVGYCLFVCFKRHHAATRYLFQPYFFAHAVSSIAYWWMSVNDIYSSY